jgi:Holliday junction resolvase RusA-like endonuclease
MIQIIYGICPSKSNSYKIGPKGFYKSDSLKAYETKFYIQCKERDKLIKGYFALYLKVFYPSERSDLDNALKVVLDCLQHCRVILNDNRCTRIEAEKYLDKKNPRIEFEIIEI